MQSISFIGPLFGYVSSGMVLKKWVNFPTVNACKLFKFVSIHPEYL